MMNRCRTTWWSCSPRSVGIESPSADTASVARCGDAVAGAAERMLASGPPERLVVDGTTHFRWRFGAANRVVLIGHLDTVWPAGTLERWPFAVDGNRRDGDRAPST